MTSTHATTRLSRRLLAIAVLLLGLATVVPPPAGAAQTAGVSTKVFGVDDLLDLATYRIQTLRRNTGGGVTDRTVNAVVGVPALVNVDAALVSPPDITVEVLPLPPNRVSILVKRLGGGALPLSVQLLFDLPGPANGGVAVGYDALSSSAPGSFRTSLTLASTPTSSDVRLDVDLGAPGGALTLVADLFTRAQGTRVDPTAVRVALDPPPRHLGAHVATDVAANRVLAELTASEPTLVGATVEETKAGRQRHLSATVDRLPTSVTVDVLSDPDAGREEVHYTASAPIASASVELTDTEGTAKSKVTATATDVPAAMNLALQTAAGQPQRATWTSSGRLGHLSVVADGSTAGVLDRQAVFEVDDLATAFELVRDGQTSITLTANSPIGSLEGGASTGGPVQLLDEAAYLHAVKTDTTSSVAARIQGLSAFSAGLAEPVSVSATVAPGPFHALLVQPGRTVDAKVLDLPSRASVVLDAKAGVLQYDGAAVIGTIDAEVTATPANPLVGKADHAHLVVSDLPTSIRLDFGPRASDTPSAAADISVRSGCVDDVTTICPDPNPEPEPDPGDDPPVGGFPDASKNVSVVIDTNGAGVGSIDLLLNTVPFLPAKPLAEDEDGLVLEDSGAQFALTGRITGLKKAVAQVRTEDRRSFDGFLTTRAHAELHTLPAGPETPRRGRVELHSGGDNLVATLSNIPPDIDVDLFSRSLAKPPNPKITRVTYDAFGTTIGDVTVLADLAAMPNPLSASITEVPAFFTLCTATDAFCHDGDGAGDLRRDGGTFLFDASSRATLDAFLCLRPSDAACDTVAEATSYVLVEDLSVQHLAFELNVGDFTPENPFHVVFDTDHTPVTGRVVLRKEDELRVALAFPGDLTVAYTGPNLTGHFTGPLSAQDLALTAFNPPGVELIAVERSGSFGCAGLEFLKLLELSLKPILC